MATQSDPLWISGMEAYSSLWIFFLSLPHSLGPFSFPSLCRTGPHSYWDVFCKATGQAFLNKSGLRILWTRQLGNQEIILHCLSFPLLQNLFVSVCLLFLSKCPVLVHGNVGARDGDSPQERQNELIAP